MRKRWMHHENGLTGSIRRDILLKNRTSFCYSLTISRGYTPAIGKRNLRYLEDLQNLVVLNISYNNLSGRVPRQAFLLEASSRRPRGNPSLCFPDNRCPETFPNDQFVGQRRSYSHGGPPVYRVYAFPHACTSWLPQKTVVSEGDLDLNGGDSGVEMGPPWEVTLYRS
ncbi:hypothetical protein K1719_003706 [Acacia pycnantha]|nr:hypothetical protein K1719_003706 [Acacia pycnantha]